MSSLVSNTRRKCFISYHHADEVEVGTAPLLGGFEADIDCLKLDRG